jgi:hypothetical protein
MLTALLLAGCTDAVPEATPPDTASPVAVLEPLPSPLLLRRISLDLRGVLPSPADLDAVAADPALLDGIVADYLDDPALEERLIDMLGERWHTLVDDVTLQSGEVGLDMTGEYAFERSVGEEPLRLMAHVAVNDLPWSEIVTADYTIANPLLAGIWPLEHPGGEGWEISHYIDGRPAAGVLSTNGLWWRYTTDESNSNRRRAAAISRLLLCEDYFERPVSFSGVDTALDDEAVAAAIKENPACTSCHSTLDPLAATLFGFWWFEEHHLDEMAWYHAAREPLGEQTLQVAPAWFGQPVGGLIDLGDAITDDPRFSRCAAETFAAALWHRPVALSDFETIDHLDVAFQDSGLRAKALLAEILTTEHYTVGALTDAASAEDESATSRRLLSPDQLADATEALTGFTWTSEGFDLMHNDSDGFRVLVGGLDGLTVFTPQRDPGLTWALVIKRLSEAAASYAVAQAQAGSPPPILAGIDTAAAPDADTLAALHWWLLAREAEADWLADVAVLWDAVEAIEGPSAAWTATLSALLRDPDFVSF